jgi:hypothetical protein
MAIEPSADKGEGRVGEVIFDVFPGARDVLLIAGFAVAQRRRLKVPRMRVLRWAPMMA